MTLKEPFPETSSDGGFGGNAGGDPGGGTSLNTRPRWRRMGRKRAGLALAVVIAVSGWTLSVRLQPDGGIQAALQRYQPGLYPVERFVDGDTIAVNMDGRVEKVRFIGIDTPETHKPDTPVQCYGPEASAYTRQLIGHGRVRLVSDPLTTDRDRYGRLLRYVYLPDGTFVNETLVQRGYAFYYPYFPFSKARVFKVDEQAAMAGHKGLWSVCKPQATDGGGYVSKAAARQ